MLGEMMHRAIAQWCFINLAMLAVSARGPVKTGPHCDGMTGMPSSHERASQLGYTVHNVEANIEIASRRSPVDGYSTKQLFLQDECFTSVVCDQLIDVASYLMVPGHACSIDGLAEYQVDLLQKPRHEERSDPRYTEYTRQMYQLAWPRIRDCMIPTIAHSYGLDPSAMRFAEAFIRRYQMGERVSVPFHQDASDVSVTIELSPRSNYTGGLFIRGPSPGREDVKLQLEQGGAVYHSGAVEHRVQVNSGTRWSMVVFFFDSCASQRRYHSTKKRERNAKNMMNMMGALKKWAGPVFAALALLTIILLRRRETNLEENNS